jgi:nicotinamide-nucleotide amidase
LRLTATGKSYEKLNEDILPFVVKISEILGKHVYGFDGEKLEACVGRLLKSISAKVAIAESCTGGKIAQTITSVSGSSNYFIGGIVCYDNIVKVNQLGVSPTLIEQYGSVSEQVVAALLSGCLNLFDSDYAIAVSGIAGPEGGTEEKPLGTTYIGVADKAQQRIHHYVFANSRNINIEYSTMFALHMLRMLIQSNIEKQP